MEMSKASQDLIATLCDRLPAAFSLKRPLPLKVGVGNEIAKMLGVNPRAVGLALGFYCNRSAYLSACKEGATRVDLDGNPAGTRPVVPDDPNWRMPIRRMGSPCCARAATGHAAAPARRVLSSRRLIIRSPRQRGRAATAGR